MAADGEDHESQGKGNYARVFGCQSFFPRSERLSPQQQRRTSETPIRPFFLGKSLELRSTHPDVHLRLFRNMLRDIRKRLDIRERIRLERPETMRPRIYAARQPCPSSAHDRRTVSEVVIVLDDVVLEAVAGE